MCKYYKGVHLSINACIIVALLVCIVHVNAATSSTCSSSSSNCTLREWLTKLQDEYSSLECTLSQLEKSTTLLSKVNYSTTTMRLTQITKLKKSMSNLKGEIDIINSTCSTFYGPDCNLTTPECNSKCISCPSPGQCSVCSGNWNGTTCSTCKTGWNGTDCNTPICDSKCVNCTLPGLCSNCTGNWNGTTCSQCKIGWNGTLCNTPICDSKCTSCASPGQCTSCQGNWDGPTCSQCKTGWNGTLCNVPICNSKCLNCSLPGICSKCNGNWNGTTCSICKTGWYGSDCSSNTPIPILNSAQITKFTNLIIPNAQLTTSKLLFKATRDGFSASTFHSKCDNKGPTIVIVKATTGAIFGGYVSSSWASTSTSVAISDNSAFLFSLISSTNEERFTKLTYENGNRYKNSVINNNMAIYNNVAYGPTFGGGFDLYIADNCNIITNSASPSNTNLCYSYCDTTLSYSTTIAQSYLAGSASFQVEDYEVYSL